MKSQRGWQSALGYTHLFSGVKAFPHPNLPYRFGSALEVVYFPLIGLELDQTLRAKEKLAEGHVTRALAQLSIQFLPAPIALRQKLEFMVGYAFRKDLKDTTNATDDSHPIFTFDANYFPLKGDRGDIGFGVTHLRGENPDEGLVRQQYWQFSIKVRVKPAG